MSEFLVLDIMQKHNSEFDQNGLRQVYIEQGDFDQGIILSRAHSSYAI